MRLHEPKQTCQFCNLRNHVSAIYSKVEDFDLSDMDKSYYAPFHLLGLANEFLACWLFLVASACFLFCKNLNYFSNRRIKAAEEVSLPDRIIPNAKANIENNATSKCDVYSQISYLDTTSNSDSLLSIEVEEDTEWLEDSISFELCSLEDPSTPLNSKFDSFSEILDIWSPNYWDSLYGLQRQESVSESYFDSSLSIELEGDSKCLLDSISFDLCSLEDPSTPVNSNYDSFFEISNIWSLNYPNSLHMLEGAESVEESYFDSLLNIELDGDNERFLDSISFELSSLEDPSTPLNSKYDSLCEISDIELPNYWDFLHMLEGKESIIESNFDSLLNIKLEEDTDWLLDSISFELCSLEDPSTPLSSKNNSFSEIPNIWLPNYWDSLCMFEGKESVRESYFDSLLSLEDEDNGWLSSEDTSTPLRQICDTLSEISDIGSPNYWDSLLRLEERDNEWTYYKGSWGAISSASSVSSLTTTVQTDEFFGDEPLFWPFQEKLNWNYEKSWTSFCSSPRKRLVFEPTSPTPMMKECKQKIVDDQCIVKNKSETSRLSMWSQSSAKIVVPLECEDDLNNTFLINENFGSNYNDLRIGKEYLAMDHDLPIETFVGLKEFDGHEGLDSEFNGDMFLW